MAETEKQVVVKIPIPIPGEESSSSNSKPIKIIDASAKAKGSPEISSWYSPTNANTSKPPKVPTTTTNVNDNLTRRRSLARSVYSKPKSRFGEPSYPLLLTPNDNNNNNNNKGLHLQEQLQTETSPNNYFFRNSFSMATAMASPNNKSARTVSITPKTPLMSSPGDADQDEEIYKKVVLSKEKHRRLKTNVLIELTVFVCILVCLVASLTLKRLKNFMVWGLEFWKWLVLVMVIFSGMLVTKWFMHLIVFLIEMNFLLRKKWRGSAVEDCHQDFGLCDMDSCFPSHWGVFVAIEGADTGRIDRKALTYWVVKIYKGRKALAHALNDTKTAVKQLNKLVTVILIVVTVIVWLLLMEIATTKALVFFSSQLVVAAFMFGNTCKTIFEAIIFVFVMHPFDVGDRCVIDGVQMMVEEMNILTTVFLKLNNEKLYYPNSVLATKPISNYYRSPDMGDYVEFSIDFVTPIERIGMLKDKIKTYLEKNPQHWHPNHNVLVKEIENVNKIKMGLYVFHTMNFQDFGEKNRRRTELVIEIKKIFEELNIRYNLLPQAVHLLNIGSETTNAANK
ncbi:hypothetical protein SO802_004748 [Lithocarpus litseifolius]|uniref:Mechanosensitive ion channel MscS domain-containing protein n=1 Tax=Lithocarpus litseifolius TaxID=425828 RepID=A0AAW2E7U3_9ROSI